MSSLPSSEVGPEAGRGSEGIDKGPHAFPGDAVHVLPPLEDRTVWNFQAYL